MKNQIQFNQLLGESSWMRRLSMLLVLSCAVCMLAACGSGGRNKGPDLTGDWSQNGTGEWYHIATITDDTIKVYWYQAVYDETQLYWSGTFVPPADDKEPYEWQSVNNATEDEMTVRTSREETKTFTYQDGTLSYIVTAGHLKMTFGLKKVS